jgi:hypothetical protein
MSQLITAVDYLHSEQLRNDFLKIFDNADATISSDSPITAGKPCNGNLRLTVH